MRSMSNIEVFDRIEWQLIAKNQVRVFSCDCAYKLIGTTSKLI